MPGQKQRSLAESSILAIGPATPESALRTMVAFVEQHRREESGSLAFIGHPLPGSPNGRSEFVLALGPGAPRHTRLPVPTRIPVVSRLLYLILTFLWLARAHRRYYMYIGGGLHSVLLGIFLRRMGLVKRVAGFAMDLWPAKCNIPGVVNRVYLFLDAWWPTHVDYVLNASSAMVEARIQQGIRVDPDRQITVPHMIADAEIGFLPQDQLEPDSLVWAGGMGAREFDFELLIGAMELVVRGRPSAVVDVTLTAKLPNHLRRMIAERGLEKQFRFLKFTDDMAQLSRMIRKHRAGLALYRFSEHTYKRYASVSRPKTYMANGVPPIITRVPPEAVEIEQAGAGIVIGNDKVELAQAILALLSDDQLHQRCRQRGLELVKKYKASSVCGEVFTRLGMPPDD